MKLLRHNTGAYIRPSPHVRCDCWVARDVIALNEYGITKDIPCNRVVDVGANVGCFAYKVLQVHPHAEIVCLEPLSEHLECLRANAPAAVVLQCALAYGRSEVDIYAPSREIHTAFQQGTGMTADPLMHVYSEPYCTVPAMTLGGVLERMGWQSADLLKLDCEMCEFEALVDYADLRKFTRIRGEYHDLERMQRLLPRLRAEGFNVTISGSHPLGKFWIGD